jgi:hypothetical protein
MTDISNGKIYVASAYGEHMILGRWKAYVNNGHGGNFGLKALAFDDIKQISDTQFSTFINQLRSTKP